MEKCHDCHAEVPELRTIPTTAQKGREVCPSCYDQWDKTFNLCDRCGFRFTHAAECQHLEAGEAYHLCPSCYVAVMDALHRALDAFGLLTRQAKEEAIRRAARQGR